MLVLQRDFYYPLIGEVDFPDEIAIVICLEGQIEMFVWSADWTAALFLLW